MPELQQGRLLFQHELADGKDGARRFGLSPDGAMFSLRSVGEANLGFGWNHWLDMRTCGRLRGRTGWQGLTVPRGKGEYEGDQGQ